MQKHIEIYWNVHRHIETYGIYGNVLRHTKWNIQEYMEIYNNLHTNCLTWSTKRASHLSCIPQDSDEIVRPTAFVNLALPIGIWKDVQGRATGRATSSRSLLLHDLTLHVKLCQTYRHIYVWDLDSCAYMSKCLEHTWNHHWPTLHTHMKITIVMEKDSCAYMRK